MTEAQLHLSEDPQNQKKRAERLAACGFNCFDPSDPQPFSEQLRYAQYEFQLYTLHAKWLGREKKNNSADEVGDRYEVEQAPSQQVCKDLRHLAKGLRLGEPWNDDWEKCLERWENKTDGPHVCPVVIVRANGVQKQGKDVDEDSSPKDVDRENVWTISQDDEKKFFFVRDFSGMFEISDTDPAYQKAPDYEPPKNIATAEWLFEPRSFMQIHRYTEGTRAVDRGVAVQPWKACEFLPDLLGKDAIRIRTDRQWRNLYRVIRALSRVECDGFFDRVQGYDVTNMSLPLFHYTLVRSGNKALTAELGGALIWLERFDPGLGEAFAAAGLRPYKKKPAPMRTANKEPYTERRWKDDRGWGDQYDAGSGADCADNGRVTGSVSIVDGVNDSADDMAFLRKPHFHYRVTMLLRTRENLRIALWKLAVHRLRNLAWMQIPGLPAECKEPQLGKVLTSEFAMAIVLRLHVFEPAKMRRRVLAGIQSAWDAVRKEHPGIPPEQLQNEFEYKFCQYFFSGELAGKGRWADHITGSNLAQLPAWPSENLFATRLRQTHLNGNGEAKPGDALPPRLSWSAYSSPFWTDDSGTPVFADPVASLDLDLDFKADGHPAIPQRYPKIELSEDLSKLGIRVQPPTTVDAADVLSQRVRESLAIRTCSHVLIDGKLADNPHLLERRVHGDGEQFWARRHIREMQHGKVASALRCGTSSVAPAPVDALWALNDPAAAGQTIHAFDWRDGLPESGASGVAYAKVGADGNIASVNDVIKVMDRAQFDIGLLPLQEQTFHAFALALGKGVGLSHLDQFLVVRGDKGWTFNLAGLRQYCPVAGTGAAAPSEWGLLIEFLAWRHARKDPSKDGWYGGPFNILRDMGFDAWLPQSATDSAQFLRQAWPAAARGAVTAGTFQAGPLDGLALCSAPRLWNAPAPARPTTPGAVTTAMLSWPSLYRMRRMFQDSAKARRAVYDLWRMGMRAALSMPMTMLSQVFGKKTPYAYQLFQSPEAIGALACWRYFDHNGLAKALKGSNAMMAKQAREWFDADPTRKDLSRWTASSEYSLLWTILVPAIDGKHREALERCRPQLPVPPRQYADKLDLVMDLDGLDSTAPPVPQIDYQAMLLRQQGKNVGLGLLTSAASASLHARPVDLRLEALSGEQFMVSGIMPVLKVGGAYKAVPLMLPQSVTVRLLRGADEHIKVGTWWAREGVEEQVDFAAFDISEPFSIEADISSWLGELGANISLTLLATADVDGSGVLTLRLGLRLASPWLHHPLEWERKVVDISGIDIINNGGRQELVWRFALSDCQALPIGLDTEAAIELAFGLENGVVAARFSVRAKAMTVGLGSPVANLRLEAVGDPLAFNADLMAGTARLNWPDRFGAYLAMELAALPGVPGDAARIVPTLMHPDGEEAKIHVPPFNILLGKFGESGPAAMVLAQRPGIDLSDLSRPRIPAWLFESGAYSYRATPACKLLDIAMDGLGDAAAAVGVRLTATASPVINRDGNQLALTLPVAISLANMAADTTLKATCALDDKGYLMLRGDSFACTISQIELTMGHGGEIDVLGGLARLRLPDPVKAMLTLDGSDPGSCFRLKIPQNNHPSLTLPASGGIQFDISEFALGSGGLTLAAKVRKGNAELDLPVLDKELAVQEPKDGIGEFHIVRGRLISASLQAKVRLKVFDDAEGVLTMRIVQGAGGMTIMANLDVGVGKTFHLRALYLQVIVASINLSLSYATDGKWAAKGGLTGSLKFSPEGPMLGRLTEYQSLFDGTSVHFENLDLSELGKSPISVMVTPRTFDVGKIFSVTWRGFVLQRPGDLGAFMGLRLLGDIAFKQRLPKMRASLTLGDITIRQLQPNSLIPKISISSIGVDIGLNGGFSFKGRITEFDDALEYGFGGEVELQSSAFPATQAMIKLTRLKGNTPLPTIAVYASTERNDSLGYGFFLRKVGMGVGIRQGLRGFSDEPGVPTTQPIAARIEKALKDPRGLPNPAHLSSWQPLVPNQHPEYTLVAYILITYGLLANDVDHPLSASAVLVIDERLNIVLGINGWLVTSPDNTGTNEYLARPAIKGALGLSPREQVLYGRFMTLPDPKFGPTADYDPLMRMVRAALKAVRLSVTMYADPRGSLIEVGWPRNARFEQSLGPANGWMEAGFRFGFYRGTQVVGLNLAAHAEITGGFSQDLGFANVSLSVTARFDMQATFAGAITRSGQCYVLAEVILSALLEVSARAYKRIRISGWGFSFTLTLFDVSATISLSATAALQTALVPSGLGFNGSVEIHIRIAGFGVGARVRISSSEGRIDEARRTIDALAPSIKDLLEAGTVQAVAQPRLLLRSTLAPVAQHPFPAAQVLPTHWRCYVVELGDELRVVLFPDAQAASAPAGYPAQAPAKEGARPYEPRQHKLWLNGDAADAFRGMVGRKTEQPPRVKGTPMELTLIEAADEQLLSHDWLRKQQPDAPRALYAGDLLADIAAETDENSEEVVDPRTIHPVAGDFDDPAVLAYPDRRSTRFRKRYGQDGVLTYDDHVRLAMDISQHDVPAVTGGTRSGELLMQLMNMARDPGALPNQTVAGPQNDDKDYDPHLLASRLGLVLSFKKSPQLKAALAKDGLLAILQPGQVDPVMFGQPVGSANWSSDASRRARFQIVPGYTFKGRGEVGLVWSLLRTSAQGQPSAEGPENHTGIACFRVQRLRSDNAQLPPLATVQVMPSWLRYVRKGTTYYVRPQFQYLDNSLPLTGSAQLEYLVEAIADDGDGNNVIASQVILVDYDAPSNPMVLTQAQAILRLPPETATDIAGTTPSYRIELQLHIDVDTRAVPERGWKAADAELKRLGERIQLFRRQLSPGVLGRYGQGHDGKVSVSWSESAAYSGKGQVSLPEIDQARQLTIDDIVISEDQIEPLNWTFDQVPAAAKGQQTTQLTYRATVDIRAATERSDWDRLLGAGCNAAELHVRLAPVTGSPGVPPELATALLRCRIALSGDAAKSKVSARAAEDGAAPSVEGTEVAALERMPLSAAVERQPEWLPLTASRFHADVSAERFVEGGRDDDIGLRLRGILNYSRNDDHPYGAVVGYRVWMQDRFDAKPPLHAAPVADFLVEPEALYRATPLAVAVRQLPGGLPGQPNWRFEGSALKMTEQWPATAGEFRQCYLDGGQQAALHGALARLTIMLEARGKVHLYADEPLWPTAGADDNRLDELIGRNPTASDVFGWRLLEALGACVTIWVSQDDQAVGLEKWEDLLNTCEETVAAVTFSRLQPGERPDGNALALYGVRVFAREVLAELLAIASAPEDIARCLDKKTSHLALALRLLTPGSTGIPEQWVDYVKVLLERSARFVVASPSPKDDKGRAAMWELSKVEAEDTGSAAGHGVKGQYAAVLPLVDGQVHLFHTMENGFARALEVAVEVVRRYDLSAPRAERRLSANVHQVPVFRTQALEPDRWTIVSDPNTGALEARVALHPAQRLVLYRSDLAARVQFIEQRVGLLQGVPAATERAWDKLFATLVSSDEGFDWQAFRASWVAGKEVPVPPLSAWRLDDDSQAIARGYDAYRYAGLAPFYEYGVHVVTQAGVRHSAERVATEIVPSMAEAMFIKNRGPTGLGLCHQAPELDWILTEDGTALTFQFALLRGVDALDERLRSHWIARDADYELSTAASGPMPVLQMPDLKAQYSLIATLKAGESPPLRVDLLQLEYRDGQVTLRSLIAPDKGMSDVSARVMQLNDMENCGRIGIGGALRLTSPELSWLRVALAASSEDWRLTVEVQRDGIRYTREGAAL